MKRKRKVPSIEAHYFEGELKGLANGFADKMEASGKYADVIKNPREPNRIIVIEGDDIEVELP